MRTVTRDEIIESWRRLCELDEKETEALVKQFMEEQPALGIFLFAKGDDLEGGLEKSPIIDLVVACWQAMTQAAGQRLSTVSPDDIEREEETNTQNLEQLEDASEMEWKDSVQDSFENYPQRELLGFSIEVLMSGHEENPELAPESIGLEMIWLKTVIDALDRDRQR